MSFDDWFRRWADKVGFFEVRTPPSREQIRAALREAYLAGRVKCDWCGMVYPPGAWDYYELWLFGREKHVICSDCYDHLKLVPTNEQTEEGGDALMIRCSDIKLHNLPGLDLNDRCRWCGLTVKEIMKQGNAIQRDGGDAG